MNLIPWLKGFPKLWTHEAIEYPDGRLEWSRPEPATKENSISYKKSWSPLKFLPIYLFNYGTRVLSGGAVVSWSKWFYLTKGQYRASKLATHVLDLLDREHGYEAGPVLWGTKDTSWAATGAVVFWVLVLVCLMMMAR
jgi:hypothetical protein